MAGDSPMDDPNLKGINRIFNSTTIKGRAHVSMATYAGIALIAAYFYLKPKKSK